MGIVRALLSALRRASLMGDVLSGAFVSALTGHRMPYRVDTVLVIALKKAGLRRMMRLRKSSPAFSIISA